MANRRMFSLDIVASDAFLEMPTSTRELYFHLGMYADDEGFVNPKKIMRMIGASEDDLKVLLGKRFLLAFESGVVVVKHWKMNNYLQNDRIKPTVYLEEKKLIALKDNNSYTECIHSIVESSVVEINSVPKGTQSIKLMEEEYTLEELSYEVEGSPKSKPKYGNRTMAILARKFAEVAGIEIGRTFDASEWAKPLGELYRRFNKDPDKTMKFFEDAGKWYTDKGLTFTPHTLEKNFTMLTQKWLIQPKNSLYE